MQLNAFDRSWQSSKNFATVNETSPILKHIEKAVLIT